jgi:hypothetical protein
MYPARDCNQTDTLSCVRSREVPKAPISIADEVDAQLKQQMLRFMAADAAEK